MTTATVIIPTHDHGPMLTIAARSALRQTVADLEVVIVGDGATDETRQAARSLEAEDRRVRFVDHPKGPRLGERYRHEVVREAGGEIVLYLCDDDVWFPEHLAHMVELLDGVDVANALSCWIRPEGLVQHTTIDLGLPGDRIAVLEGRKNPGLSAMGHTRRWYDGLPEGWRTTPEGTPTDLHMWRQLLASEDVRGRSGMVPTMVHLPSPPRRHMSIEERYDELQGFEGRIADPGWRQWFAEAILDRALRECAYFEDRSDHLKAWGDRLERWSEHKERELVEIWESRAACQQEVARLAATLAAQGDRGGGSGLGRRLRAWRRRRAS